MPLAKRLGRVIYCANPRQISRLATNDSYDTHRLFAEWVPAKLGLKDTRIDFTVDNLFNRSYRQPLGGDLVYSQGRNAKISVTQFF
nr:TonB-dependent receptor [Pseudomonas aeruginosa]